MKEKGFTLIELLAVIVILAIIALIATPIILDIIKDSKEQAKEISAENYLSAVEQAIVRRKLKEEFNPDICLVNDGVVICNGYDEPLKVEVAGEKAISGTIVLDKGKVTDGTNFTIGGTPYEIVNGKLKKEGPEHLVRENVRAVTESTTGIVPVVENDNIKSGSEFKIKVSNNIKDETGNIVEYTFFVLSNSDDGKYVNLIAEQNIVSDGAFTAELQDGDEWYTTSSNTYDNRYGPQTAYTYLNAATSNWTNIPIIKSFYYENKEYKEGNEYNSSGYQSIKTELEEQTGKYITTITPNSLVNGTPVTYENMRVRLPYMSEITTNTSCKIYESSSDIRSCPLWMVNYLYGGNSATGLIYNERTISEFYAYWLLDSYITTNDYPKYQYARVIGWLGYIGVNHTNVVDVGIRPVITVLKSDLLRVM